MLIALAITGVITAAVMQAYVTQHKNYLTQEDITVVQQGARVSLDQIAKNLRMAGNGLPVGISSIMASNTNPDTITITYRLDDCDATLSAPMPLPSAELKCAGNLSCFWDGQWVYIFHPDSGGGEFFEITHVQAAAGHVQHNTMPLSKKYGTDAILLSMERVKFYIDNTTDTAHPRLMVEVPGSAPAIYADDIVDLQFRYQLDNGSVADVPVLVEDVREVKIAVTGRSASPDYESSDD